MVEQLNTAGRVVWTLPGGVEAGETPAEAVIRELGEETGLAGVVVRQVSESPDAIFLLAAPSGRSSRSSVAVSDPPDSAHNSDGKHTCTQRPQRWLKKPRTRLTNARPGPEHRCEQYSDSTDGHECAPAVRLLHHSSLVPEIGTSRVLVGRKCCVDFRLSSHEVMRGIKVRDGQLVGVRRV